MAARPSAPSPSAPTRRQRFAWTPNLSARHQDRFGDEPDRVHSARFGTNEDLVACMAHWHAPAWPPNPLRSTSPRSAKLLIGPTRGFPGNVAGRARQGQAAETIGRLGAHHAGDRSLVRESSLASIARPLPVHSVDILESQAFRLAGYRAPSGLRGSFATSRPPRRWRRVALEGSPSCRAPAARPGRQGCPDRP